VETIGAQAADRGYEPTQAHTVADAIDIALKDRAPIIITGSLFMVADAREAWFARTGQLLEKD
jgi:hypothetical protein